MERTTTKMIMAAVFSLAAAGAAAAADSRVEDMKSAGRMRVCTVDYAPLVQKDPRTNEWQGLYVDLTAQLAEVLAVKVEYVESSWRTFVQNLQTDKCDLSIAPAYPTAARALQVMFTDPVSEDGQAVWALTEAGYTSIEEIDQPGKIVGVRAGSANERYARQIFRNAEVKPIVSDVQAATLMEVTTKRIDAALIATMSAQNIIANNPNLAPITSVGDPSFPSSIAWSVPRGEYHFQQVLNAFFADVATNGTLDTLRAKWLKD